MLVSFIQHQNQNLSFSYHEIVKSLETAPTFPPTLYEDRTNQNFFSWPLFDENSMIFSAWGPGCSITCTEFRQTWWGGKGRRRWCTQHTW